MRTAKEIIGKELNRDPNEDGSYVLWISRIEKVMKDVNWWLSEFYKIDLVKLENEKRQMLEEIRKLQGL